MPSPESHNRLILRHQDAADDRASGFELYLSKYAARSFSAT